jgi:hypothetical protein
MTSKRKIANRQNARKSTGPKTRRGKAKASRNSVRHGLEQANYGVAGFSKKVKRLARALCKDTSDPFRYEQAVIIAESQILIARVRAARVAALEHPRAPAGSSPRHPGADQGAPAREQLRMGKMTPTTRQRRPCPDAQQEGPELGDSAANVRRAMPELLSLERYERRAVSRRKRAIRRFDALGE